MDAKRQAFSLPPRYVNVPAKRIYDARVSASAALTFLRIYGLHWDKKNPPRLSFKGWMRALDMRKTTLYDHLKELEKLGWLSSSTDGEGVLAFEFEEKSGFPEGRSEIRNDATLLITDSNLQDVYHSDAAVRNPGKRTDKKQKAKKIDPRLEHPAVKLYRQVMHLTASESQRQTIVDTVTDVDLWRDTLEHWASHGWRPTNLPGMLDSYQRGGSAACASCRRIGRKARPRRESAGDDEQPAAEELRAMIVQARRQKSKGDGRAEADSPGEDRDAG
jgi:hypothetical protein